MNIDIKSIPFKDMPYPSLDGYWDNPDGSVSFRTCSEMSEQGQFLVLIHAMTEYFMCKFKGISEPDIQAWDLKIEELIKQGKLSIDEDPGYSIIIDPTGAPIQSPYRDQHHLSTAIEALLLPFVGITEAEYYDEMESLWGTRNDQISKE